MSGERVVLNNAAVDVIDPALADQRNVALGALAGGAGGAVRRHAALLDNK